MQPGAASGDFLTLLDVTVDTASPDGATSNNAALLLEAVQEAVGVLGDSGGLYDGASTDVFLDCLLRRLPREVPSISGILDCEKAAARFRERANAQAEIELHSREARLDGAGQQAARDELPPAFEAFKLPAGEKRCQEPIVDSVPDTFSFPKGKTSRKRGAPIGHPGSFRPTPTEYDELVLVTAPARCPHCGGEVRSFPKHDPHDHLQEDETWWTMSIKRVLLVVTPPAVAAFAATGFSKPERVNVWAAALVHECGP